MINLPYLCFMQKDGRTLSKETQQEIRLRVIRYWRKNKNMTKTAKNFDIPLITVRKWVGKYKNEGLGSLKEDKRGRPKGKELTVAQEKDIRNKITGKQPEQLKLAFGLWM